MKRVLEEAVRRRAGERCEYCHLPEAVSLFKHSIDHVIAQQHMGPTTLENLALCCARCNQHKGPNLSGIDPQTGNIVQLFHPRRQAWREHFRWDGAELVGLTDVGRATVGVLAINLDSRVAARQGLIDAGEVLDDE